jgi:FtsH-binding integral membrane protein
MGSKIYKFFEYAYILMAIAAVCLVFINWEENRERAYVFIFFTIVAIFMFFFKRRFRKMTEERYTKKDE